MLLGLTAWRRWPEGAPEPLGVRDVVLTLDPASGVGACPSATGTPVLHLMSPAEERVEGPPVELRS